MRIPRSVVIVLAVLTALFIAFVGVQVLIPTLLNQQQVARVPVEGGAKISREAESNLSIASQVLVATRAEYQTAYTSTVIMAASSNEPQLQLQEGPAENAQEDKVNAQIISPEQVRITTRDGDDVFTMLVTTTPDGAITKLG